jgi:adenosylmethionine-8-amino-7-oxononanoate aminotransferase
MIWAFEVRSDNPRFGREFSLAALDRELLLRPIGNTVYFMPPYIIDEGQWRHLVEGTIACIDRCA